MNTSRTFLRCIAAAVLLAATTLPVFAAGSQESAQPRTVSVGGEGAVQRTPDIATIRMGVQTENEQAQTAVQANANRMQAVMQSLELLEIPADRIQTVGYNVIVQRPDSSPRSQESAASNAPVYRVTNTVQVTLDDTKKTGAVIDAAFSAGAGFIQDVRFSLSSTAAAETEALELAMDHARSKAEHIAAAAGAELGRALTVHEEYGRTPRAENDMVMYARSAAATPISAGDYTVSARVQITFELE